MIKRVFLCPACLYSFLENWLKKMSLRGWHLVQRKLRCIYFFEQGDVMEKEYFVWDPTYTGEGKYSIGMRYPSIMKTYGVHKKKSKLNYYSSQKHDTIIEVDIKKISNLDFLELKNDRNRLYALRFIRNLLIIVILTVAFLLHEYLC